MKLFNRYFGDSLIFSRLVIIFSVALICFKVHAKDFTNAYYKHLKTMYQNTKMFTKDVRIRIDSGNPKEIAKVNIVFNLAIKLITNEDVDKDPLGKKVQLIQSELNQLVQVIQTYNLTQNDLNKVVNKVLNSQENVDLDSKNWMNKILSLQKDADQYKENWPEQKKCAYSYGDTLQDAKEVLGLKLTTYEQHESDLEGRFVIIQCYCVGLGCSDY